MAILNGPSNDWFWDRVAEAIKAFLVGAYVVGAGIVYRIYQRGVQRDVRIADLERRTANLERYCREQKEIAAQVRDDIRRATDDMKDIRHNIESLTLALLRPPGH